MIRDSLDFDVVIVGAGPAGLTAAIRLAQLSQQQTQPLNICIVDKGAEVGAHILSGAVLEPRTLDELLPDWRKQATFLRTPAKKDRFLFLTDKRSWRLPTPPQMKNHGNEIISLGLLCRFLAEQAEALGVNIFPGFAATEIIYEGEKVCGIITGDKGLDRHDKPKQQYQPGIALKAPYVIFAEGCRGSLTQTLFERYSLRKGVDPQTYALGIKELWEIPTDRHHAGEITHTIGWPLDFDTYGGSFIYHLGENLLALGLVVGLDYSNPFLNPYEEFQKFKTHPLIANTLKKGKRIAYGARTLVEGGLQSLPRLVFPGGLIVGDAAGFLNVPKIKGIHTAMKSAMIAAESLFPLLINKTTAVCEAYPVNLKNSWLWKELHKVRNIRPAMNFGLLTGIFYSAIDTYLLRGHAPWTFHHRLADHLTLKKAYNAKKLLYPKHDNIITFDLPSSTYLANINYDENQPHHLKLKSRHEVPVRINLKEYDSPETRYCPAGVYEILYNEKQEARLHINGGNCIHCKACDIKDPTQNIVWTPPEGGSGPQYNMM